MNPSPASPCPTCLRTTILAGPLIGLLLLAGCANVKTVPVVETRSLDVPPSLLRCMPEPEARAAWRGQRYVALFLIRLAEAGEDCRVKLEAVGKLVEKP